MLRGGKCFNKPQTFCKSFHLSVGKVWCLSNVTRGSDTFLDMSTIVKFSIKTQTFSKKVAYKIQYLFNFRRRLEKSTHLSEK